MAVKKYAKILTVLCILGILCFGLYINFYKSGPNAAISQTVMVFAYK